MRKKRNNYGFSLTEVLLAVGTLSIGMIFVAGVFPVAIHFSTIATERTIAAVVADEAFAKIRLYGINPDSIASEQTQSALVDSDVTLLPIDPCEFAYPSTYRDITEKHYFWSALCRRVGDTRLVQVTVFVSRKTNPNQVYHTSDGADDSYLPLPVEVGVLSIGGAELTINNPVQRTFINDGYTIVDDETGRLYRVRERLRAPDDDATIVLDRPWDPGLVFPDRVWVVPPPAGGGRYPCIAVYQKVIRF